MLVEVPGVSTLDVPDGAATASSVLAMTVKGAARDTLSIPLFSRCRAVRLVPEAVVRCDANPEEMVGSIIALFWRRGGMSKVNFLID